MSDGLDDALLLWSLADLLRAVDRDDRSGLEDSLTTYADDDILVTEYEEDHILVYLNGQAVELSFPFLLTELWESVDGLVRDTSGS